MALCSAAILFFSHPAEAQSGRRQVKSVSSPPVAAPSKPEANPQIIQPSVAISSIVVVGEVVHNYSFYRSSYLGSALGECVNSLKKGIRPTREIEKGGRMTLTEAKERAKRETGAHVLWLAFKVEDNSIGEMFVSYIDYAVLVPQSAKLLTSGRIVPGEQSVLTRGGILTIPSTAKRLPALSQMKNGAREVAYRLGRGGWL